MGWLQKVIDYLMGWLQKVIDYLMGWSSKLVVTVWGQPRLQALIYDILPSTTAIVSYIRGSRKLSANEQFFVGAPTSKSVAKSSNKTRCVIYSCQQSLHQLK